MKNSKSTIFVFIILVIACALYRVWDSRPLGFAPQIAMALFAGSVIRDKRIAFLFPVLSMLISDALYQVLYTQHLTDIRGFYDGQWINYLLIASVTIIGFFIRKNSVTSIIGGSLAGVAYFFLASNFADWIGGGLALNNLPYPKTWDGLMSCYAAGVPFLKGSLMATGLFNAVFFGVYYLVAERKPVTNIA
jgi:hypothetical protein